MSLVTLILLAVGLAMLVCGAELLVRGASALAASLGISRLVIGLTVVAFGTSAPEMAVSVMAAWEGQAGIALGNVVGSNICNVLLILGLSAVVAPLVVAHQVVRLEVPIMIGTSLPELATSVVASLRGERDIAVGNVVGSNIFNILAVLGLTALVAPTGLPVPPVALTFDLPVMLAVAVACLPIFMAGYRISRWEGLLFLFYYVVYVLSLVFTVIDHDSRLLLGQAVLWFALPLTVLTLGISLWRHRHPSRHGSDSRRRS